MPHHFAGEWNWGKIEKRVKNWDETHTFGFEEGRSATEISTAIRLLAAAARESGVQSLDLLLAPWM